MRGGRIKSGLALVGACAALSMILPPLAGLLNAIGSVTLLAVGGYSAYRAWAWMETVVEASRRPTTVRRNLSRSDGGGPPGTARTKAKAPARVAEPESPADPEERRFGQRRWTRRPRPSLESNREP